MSKTKGVTAFPVKGYRAFVADPIHCAKCSLEHLVIVKMAPGAVVSKITAVIDWACPRCNSVNIENLDSAKVAPLGDMAERVDDQWPGRGK